MNHQRQRRQVFEHRNRNPLPLLQLLQKQEGAMTVRGPRSTDNCPDRQLECEESLEEGVLLLFEDLRPAVI